VVGVKRRDGEGTAIKTGGEFYNVGQKVAKG